MEGFVGAYASVVVSSLKVLKDHVNSKKGKPYVTAVSQESSSSINSVATTQQDTLTERNKLTTNSILK